MIDLIANHVHVHVHIELRKLGEDFSKQYIVVRDHHLFKVLESAYRRDGERAVFLFLADG